MLIPTYVPTYISVEAVSIWLNQYVLAYLHTYLPTCLPIRTCAIWLNQTSVRAVQLEMAHAATQSVVSVMYDLVDAVKRDHRQLLI